LEDIVKRTLLFAATALALLIPVTSLAQQQRQSAGSQVSSSSAHQRQPSEKPRTISAIIADDGKSFLDSKQNHWTVVNPTVLAGLANQRVRIKYLVTAATNSVEILAVNAMPTLTMLTAHPSDSAFRR
jgi:hypothetical protein